MYLTGLIEVKKTFKLFQSIPLPKIGTPSGRVPKIS
jgi:hypothetical protein